MVVITFDPAKAEANLAKHGVSFADAARVLYDPLAVTIEDSASVDEHRYVTVGMGREGNLLVVVYTLREGGIRLISARHATRKERKDYEA